MREHTTLIYCFSPSDSSDSSELSSSSDDENVSSGIEYSNSFWLLGSLTGINIFIDKPVVSIETITVIERTY